MTGCAKRLRPSPASGCSKSDRAPATTRFPWPSGSVRRGRSSLLDVQQDFLDHTTSRAREHGLSNLVPTLADAQAMPYDDATFDGAYLATVLGEIPDRSAALRELRRVVKPGGRVVFGELFGDPHMVTEGALRREAEAAGLSFERRFGPPFGFFARFRVP